MCCDHTNVVHDEESSQFYCPACRTLVDPLAVGDWHGATLCLPCATYLRIQAAIAEREAEASRWHAYWPPQFFAAPRHALES